MTGKMKKLKLIVHHIIAIGGGKQRLPIATGKG
jgi:hypothetical protein